MVRGEKEEKSIKLTVLGSGTCVPRMDRGSPGFFLEIDKTRVLLDCGSGTVRQVVKAGKDYKDIDFVIISHLHIDHTNDLPALFHALNYTPDFKRTKDLFLLGGKGFKEFFNNLIKAFPHIKPRPFTYEIKLLDKRKLNKLNKFALETIPGSHDLSSIIIKIRALGKKIVYTGDTNYDEKISKFSKGADLLILECSYPDERKVRGHLTPRLAGRIASEARVKKLLLAHFYPVVDKTNIKVIVRKYYSGEIILATDLIELTI